MRLAGHCSSSDAELLRAVLDPVQQTCYDAWLSKYLAAQCGFFEDPYIALLNPVPTAQKAIEAEGSNSGRKRNTGRSVGAPASASRQFLESGVPAQSRGTAETRQEEAQRPDQRLAALLDTDYGVDPVLLHGTYARVVGIRRLVAFVLERFGRASCICNDSPSVEVISVGAGMDSLPFWLLGKRLRPEMPEFGSEQRFPPNQELPTQLQYHELDMDQVAMLKASCIQRHEALARVVQASTSSSAMRGYRVESSASRLDAQQMTQVNTAGCSMHRAVSQYQVFVETPVYSLVAVDLAQGRSAIEAALGRTRRHRISPAGPNITLILLECVLAYLSEQEMLQLFEALREHTRDHPAILVCYDPIDLSDPFGRHMRKRLEERGAPLLGPNCTVNLAEAVRKLEMLFVPEAAPYSHARGLTMMQVYEHLRHDPTERSRLDQILALDETEELALLMRHYALIWVGNRHAGHMDVFGDH
jgi:hypothetical protein